MFLFLLPLDCWSYTFTEATLPQSTVTTTYSAPTGTTYTVGASGCDYTNLQTAINAASPGDIISVTAGETFTGNFTLPEKSNPNNKWIYIQSSAYSSLPAPSTRVALSDASNMARIKTTTYNGTAISADNKANYYRLVGLELYATTNHCNYLTLFGDRTLTDENDQPHHIIIDRCYLHGDSDVLYPVVFSGPTMAIIDSYLSDLRRGAGSGYNQGIKGDNGRGPYKIQNNYIEVATINVMFGGDATYITNMIPSDIEIKDNHFTKKIDWYNVYACKTHFEIKNAQRVLIDGNEFDNSWVAKSDQRGQALNLRTQGSLGGQQITWAACQDITITNNIFHDVGTGITITGDGTGVGNEAKRIKIENNLFYDLKRSYAKTNQCWPVMIDSNMADPKMTRDIIYNHNTAVGEINAGIYFAGGGKIKDDIEITNSIFGVIMCGGACACYADLCIERHFTTPATDFYGNYCVFVGGNASDYNTYFGSNIWLPSSINDIGFVSIASDNYRLDNTSPYKNAASDGTDVGVDVDQLAGGVTENPTLTGYNPADEATGVSKSSNISFTVNDDTQVDNTTIDVTVEGGNAIVDGVCQSGYACTITASGNGYNVVINPDTDFSSYQSVEVTVYAEDEYENSVTNNTWNFRVEDYQDPTLTGYNPADGATEISPNTNIYVEVDDDVQVSNTTIDVTVEGANAIVNGVFQSGYSGTVRVNGTGYDITITPASPFNDAQVVDVTIYAEDTSGNSVTESAWNFTVIDDEAPTLTNFNPADEATGQSRSVSPFFEIDDNVGVNNLSIDVTIEAVNAIINGVFQSGYTGTITASGTGYNVTINPSAQFSYAQAVEMTVYAEDTAVTPNSVTLSDWNFTIRSEPVPVSTTSYFMTIGGCGYQ